MKLWARAGLERGKDAWSAVRGALRSARRRLLPPRTRAPGILVVDEMLPDARFGAGYPRAAQLLRAIAAAGWRVTAYAMVGSKTDAEAVARNFAAVRFVRSAGERGLRRLLRESVDEFDVVLVSRPAVMQAFQRACSAAPRLRARVACVYDAEAIFALRDARRQALFGLPPTPQAVDAAIAREISVIGTVDAIVAVTQAEARRFAAAGFRAHVIGHCIRTEPSARRAAGRSDLLFVGRCTGRREDSPNVDSLAWFIDEVMPRLDRHLGSGYRLVVAGLADAECVARHASPRVVFQGVVDDLSGLYDRCRLFIAPTRYAAGLPLKVVEAAATGLPCVVTPLLAGQLGFTAGEHALCGETADDFAAACARLYDEDALWQRLRDAALARVQAMYSPAAFDRAVRELLAECGSRHAGSRHVGS